MSSWGTCGTIESNAEFWKAWHMVAMLKQERWSYYYKVWLGYGAPAVEGRAAEEYYRGVQAEIKKELNISTATEKTEENTPDSDLPF